jgi:D-ribose pyranase
LKPPIESERRGMKKAGILHKELASCISGMGHYDQLTLVSCLYGIPKNAATIDLALKRGIPKMIDVLQAIKEEMTIEKIIIAKEMELNHQDLHRYILQAFSPAAIEVVVNERLKEQAAHTKYFVRTGENVVFSNIIVQASFSTE